MTLPSGGYSTVMTDKQLASMVRFGRRVTFYCDKAPDVVGYVIGFDDEDVRIATVVDGEIKVVMRHRNYIAGKDPDEKTTYRTEPVADELEAMIAPFRKYVTNRYFDRS